MGVLDQFTEGFDEFWREYPKRVSKKAAVRAWSKLRPSPVLRTTMLAALKWQKETPGWKKGFVPNAATWINGERWEDEPFHAPPNGGTRHSKPPARPPHKPSAEWLALQRRLHGKV